MPTREEIALDGAALKSATRALVRRQFRQTIRTYDDLDVSQLVEFSDDAEATVRAYIHALPSLAPVGEAALHARAEAAEAALAEIAGETQFVGDSATDIANMALSQLCAAQQTAAAEAREEGR